MSRYVEIDLGALTLDEVEAALTELGLPYHRPRHRVVLEGSLECTGEPVDLRLEAGVLDSVEDFGFVLEGARLRMVCGELDRAHLQAELVPGLERARAAAAVLRAAPQAGLRVTEEHVAADGSRRLVLEVDD